VWQDGPGHIVDGREAATFPVRVEEGLEEPARLMLDL
jgi:pyruvate/2-oxoglutarate dehydrogenase complex dihydrolipoamide acyltransferase (E2) component